MKAFLLSVALLQYWTILGFAVTRVLPARLRQNDAAILASPALGIAASLVPLFWLSRLGLPVGNFAIWFVLASVGASSIVLLLALRRDGFNNIAIAYARIMPVLVATAALVGWPMFVHGFDWLGVANDDMANDVLAAHRFVSSGYFGLPSLSSELNGSDIPGMYWTIFATSIGIRAGNDLMLALWIAVTGLNGFQLIGGFLAALHASLIGAVAALAATRFEHRASIYLVLLLAVVNPLLAEGTLLQLGAQVGGCTLLVAAFFMLSDPWDDRDTAAALGRAGGAALMFAALLIWYPEVSPILGGGALVYFTANYRKWTKSRLFFLTLCVGALCLIMITNKYIFDVFVMLRGQISHGILNDPVLNQIFFQFLKPQGIVKFWGLSPLYLPDSPWVSIYILVGTVISALLIVILYRQLLQRELAACILAVMLVLAGRLGIASAGFGLFKLAMIIQPFVILVLAIEADQILKCANRRRAHLHRWGLPAFAILALAFSVSQGKSLYASVLQTLDTGDHSISALNAASQEKLTSSLIAITKVPEKPQHYIIDVPGIFGFKIASLYTQGIPIVPISDYPYTVERGGWAWADPNMARNAEQRQLNSAFMAGIEYQKTTWPSGLADVIQLTPPQQQSIGPTDILLPMGPRFAPLNRSYSQFGKQRPLLGVPMSEVENYLIVIPTLVARIGVAADTPAYHQAEPDYYFSNGKMFGTGRYLFLRALNPTPNARLAVSYSRTLVGDNDNRLPAATVGDNPAVSLGFVGYGSARIFSPSVPFVQIGGRPYVMLDLGLDPKELPYHPSGLSSLFGTQYNPDPRKIVGWVRDISLVADNVYDTLRPPRQISHFPDDLANRELEYSGLYEDGWVGERAFVRIAGNREKARFVLKGQYPGGVPGAPATTTIRILADGVEIGAGTVNPGDFTLAFDLPATTANTVKIDIESSSSYHLPGLDGRGASFLLFSIGWNQDKNADGTAAPPAMPIVPSTNTFSDDPYTSDGVDADGWIKGEASIAFNLAAPKRTTLSVFGQLPGKLPYGAATETLRLEINGSEVARKTVKAGDFTLEIEIPPTDGKVNLNIAGDASFPLAPPDHRTASLRLTGIRWGHR